MPRALFCPFAVISLLLGPLPPATAQDAFRAGTAYDYNSNKTSGYIAVPYTASNSYILFKSDSVGEPTKIKIDKLKAFTVERDSFAVLRHFKVFGHKRMIKIPIGFGKVIVADGPVILYENTFSEYHNAPGGILFNAGVTVGTASNSLAFLLQQRDGTKLTPVDMGINEFISQMEKYFSSNEEIVRQIRNREYSYFTLERLVRDFNDSYRRNSTVTN